MPLQKHLVTYVSIDGFNDSPTKARAASWTNDLTAVAFHWCIQCIHLPCINTLVTVGHAKIWAGNSPGRNASCCCPSQDWLPPVPCSQESCGIQSANFIWCIITRFPCDMFDALTRLSSMMHQAEMLSRCRLYPLLYRQCLPTLESTPPEAALFSWSRWIENITLDLLKYVMTSWHHDMDWHGTLRWIHNCECISRVAPKAHQGVTGSHL